MVKTFLITNCLIFSALFSGGYNIDSLSRKYVNIVEPLASKETIINALVELNQIHNKSIKEKDSVLLGFVLFHKAYINLVGLEEFSTSLDYFLQALKVYENLNSVSKVNSTMLQIALIYYRQKNYEEAISVFEKVRKASDLDSNMRRKAIAVYLQGLSETEVNRFPESEKNLRLAIDLYKEISYEQGVYEALSGLGLMHLKKENADSALYYLTKTNEFFLKKNDAESLVKFSAHVSSAHLLNNDVKAAIKSAELALEYGKLIDNERYLKVAYESLHNALASSGRYKDAYLYSLKYNDINEEHFNESNYNRSLELRTQYEKEKIEREIAVEQARIEEINLAQLNKQKLFRNFFFICFLLVLIIIFILFNRYKVKSTKNRELAETLEKLKKTQSQLLHHEKLASLGRLMAGIAHEIQNPLNFVNNFSELSKDLIEEYKNNSNPVEKNEIMTELISNMEKINFHGKRADSIVRNMLQHGRKSEAIKQSIDINQLSTEFLSFAYYGYKAANKDVHVAIEKNLSSSLPEVKVVQQDLSRVLINLFNNSFDAIHHKAITNTNGYSPKLILETSLAGNKVLIKIKDNGSGISEEIKEKIFDPFFTTKPAGAGTGLGLSISNDIVLAHGGRIDIISDVNKFTEVVVELPIN